MTKRENFCPTTISNEVVQSLHTGTGDPSRKACDGESLVSNLAALENQTGDPPPDRWAILFSIGGDLRFISHHDTLRLFRRAIARADLPIRYSQGFNPQPRIMIPLPRPLGIASAADCLVVELASPMDSEELWRRLAEQAPQGLTVAGARKLKPGEKLVPDLVRYELEADGRRPVELAAAIDEVLQADSLEMQRTIPKNRTTKVVDIRPYIVGLSADAGFVRFTLRVTGVGTAKPAEIASLLGFDSTSINHKIERKEIIWQQQQQ